MKNVLVMQEHARYIAPVYLVATSRTNIRPGICLVTRWRRMKAGRLKRDRLGRGLDAFHLSEENLE